MCGLLLIEFLLFIRKYFVQSKHSTMITKETKTIIAIMLDAFIMAFLTTSEAEVISHFVPE